MSAKETESRKKDDHLTNKVDRIGMIARWRPVHLGHAPVLRALCDRASEAFIGIGSSNIYDVRSPFTLKETIDMIQIVLADRQNYSLIPIPDLFDGPRWRIMVLEMFGALDLFVTENPYVASLLSEDYQVVRPVTLVSEDERVAIDGSLVRREMARGNDWQHLVPREVADYITAKGLDERFRREFGLETLALDAIKL